MKEVIISFETAKLAKEKKFDIPTLHCYEWVKNHGVTVCKNEQTKGSLDNWNNHTGEENGYNLIFYSAPTQSLLQKWLRDVYQLHITVFYTSENKYEYSVGGNDKSSMHHELVMDLFDSYEEALEKGLEYCLLHLV